MFQGKAQFFCGISAAPFFSGKACARAVFLPGGQGAAGVAVLPPAAERPGVRRFGCYLRVSVYFVPAHAGRLRPGVAGPSCQGKGWQEQGSVVPGHWRYSALAQAQRFPQRTIRPLFAEESPSASCCFCLRRNNLFSALRAPGAFKRPGREGRAGEMHLRR